MSLNRNSNIKENLWLKKMQEDLVSHYALIWIKIFTIFKSESVNIKAVTLRNCHVCPLK